MFVLSGMYCVCAFTNLHNPTMDRGKCVCVWRVCVFVCVFVFVCMCAFVCGVGVGVGGCTQGKCVFVDLHHATETLQ